MQHWRLEGTSSMPAPKLQYIIGLPQQSRCGYEASVQSTLCRHRCGVSVLALLCAGVEEEYLCQTYYKPAQIVGIWISKPKQQNNIFFSNPRGQLLSHPHKQHIFHVECVWCSAFKMRHFLPSLDPSLLYGPTYVSLLRTIWSTTPFYPCRQKFCSII